MLLLPFLKCWGVRSHPNCVVLELGGFFCHIITDVCTVSVSVTLSLSEGIPAEGWAEFEGGGGLNCLYGGVIPATPNAEPLLSDLATMATNPGAYCGNERKQICGHVTTSICDEPQNYSPVIFSLGCFLGGGFKISV